jgi:CRP-like cAMP-binding protein
MSIEDDIALLERVPLLRLLGKPALRMIAIGADQREIAAGDFLFHEGDISDSGYVVQRGNVRVAQEGDEARAVLAGPGVLVGESALIVEGPRRANAEALERTSCLCIPRKLFHKILESDPDAALRLRDAIAARTNAAAKEFSAVRQKLSPR